MDAVVEKIRALADNHPRGEILPVLPRSYEALPFSTSHYSPIPSSPTPSSAAFIDGGHAILLDAPHFCVAFLRVHTVIYKYAKRISSKTAEAYVIISTPVMAQGATYTTDILPLRGSFPAQGLLSFDSLDATIRTGTRRFSPSSVAGIARRFAELYLALETLETMSEGDMIVIDGLLQHSYTNEEHLLEQLKQHSLQRSIRVIGLSKTNSILTTAGTSFAEHLAKRQGTWSYAPVGMSSALPHISFVRLHESSPHVFMMESFQELGPREYSALASYARDPVFLGYPYGLIEADRAARVSAREAASLQFQLQERLGTSFFHAASARNAHTILDKISF